MQFELAANSTPSATITSKGATCSVAGNVVVNVVPPKGDPIYAFTLGLTLYGTGEVNVAATNITAQVAYVGCDLSLAKTSPKVGSFNTAILTDLVNLAVSKGMIPYLNKVLGVGFPIPVVDGVSLNNINVVYGDGYVGLASDF